MVSELSAQSSQSGIILIRSCVCLQVLRTQKGGSGPQAGALIVAARRAPEKVFGLLDMQEHLEAAAGPLARVLAGTACSRMLADLVQLAAALRAEARATLGEFEATIAHDAPRGPPPDGTVHPLAAYTLSFLKRMFGYEAAVETLFGAPADDVAALAALRAGGAAARRAGGAGHATAERAAVRAAVCHILEVLLVRPRQRAHGHARRRACPARTGQQPHVPRPCWSVSVPCYMVCVLPRC